MKFFTKFTVLSVLLSILLVSCPEVNNPTDISNKIQTGEQQILPIKSISSVGGTIIFGDEAKELKGMKINVPANSYQQSRTFSVSFAKIETHKFGERFKPISPLIKISNGGGYSERIMTLEIPAELTDKSIAVAFFYNDKTGELEPLPVIRYTGGKVVIATRHFMTNGLNQSKIAKLKQPEVLVDELYSHIVLSEVKEEDLIKAGIMSSGFEPGVDDWEFTNWGSIATPGGNCSGHTLSSLWYYSYKKKTTGKGLYHLYDKYDKASKPDPFWQDNPLGIKLVSVVQKDQFLYWDKLLSDFYTITRANYDDLPHFFTAYSSEGIKAAAAQIFITGEPMFTIVANDEVGTISHAVVAYSVDYVNGKINVADPNFPSTKGRFIEFADGKFKTYLSGENASQPNSTSYKYFAFFGKSALFNWENIAFNWAELENKTIGSKIFPKVEYFTYDKNGNEIELPDNMPLEANEQIKIICRIDPKGVKLDDTYISLYDNDVELVRSDKGKLEVSYILDVERKNKTFGIFVWDLDNENKVMWIDFRWLKVQDLSINPPKMNGEKNKEYTWSAVINNPPSNARYEWNFGDKTPIVKIKNNKDVKHIYTEDGVFPIILEIYDESNNQLFGVATAYAIIGAGLIDTTYILEFTPGWLADKYPTFEITIKGVITANDLQLKDKLKFYKYPYYVYQCKVPTDFNLELSISIKYISGIITEKTGFYYGLYKSEYEFEVLNKGFTMFTDPDKTFSKMQNYRCDSTSNIFRIKGTMKNLPSNNGNAMVVLRFYNMLKSTDYYRENDGTEYTKVSYYEGADMFFGFTVLFTK